MLRQFIMLSGVATLLAFLAGSAWAVPYVPYCITDLGTLGGTGTTKAYSINNSGQIVGVSTNSDEYERAFFWSNGAMTDMGTPGCDASAYYFGEINNNGVAAGSVHTSPPIYDTYSFLWNSGTMTYLLGSAGTDTELVSEAINDSGMVVGAEYGGIQNQAFLYSGGSLTDLGTPLGFYESQAHTINNQGLVGGEGYYTSNPSAYVPFLYDSTTGSTTMLNTIIPGAQKVADINDNGWIIGEGGTATYASKSFLYNKTMSVDVGALPGQLWTELNGMNNNGQTVGRSWGNTASEAVIYDAETAQITSLYDLLSPAKQAEWDILRDAYSINDSGQIVGYGWQGGEDLVIRGYLATPTLFGDANIDGSVNGTDLNAVLSNYNQTFTGDNMTRWMAGDFNVDGSVNGTDLNTVLSNYNQSINASTAAVPEPSTLLLAALGLACLSVYVRRKNQ